MRMGNKNSHKNDSQSPCVSRDGSRRSCPTTPGTSTEIAQSPNPTVDQKHFDDASLQPIQLSQYQKSILRDAWQRISKKGTGNIGSLIFRRMMAKNSDIKKLFQHVTGVEGVFGFGVTPIKVYRHHSVLFVKVLDSAISNLDDLRPFVLECVEYGEKHGPYKKYGFSPDMWDVFGECMTEAAREWEGWKKHRETLRAWTILISFIVDRMRQGYEHFIRRETFMQQLSYKPPSTDTLDRAGTDQDDQRTSSNTDQPRSEHNTERKLQIIQQITNAASTASNSKSPRTRRQSNAVFSKSPIFVRSKSALDIHSEDTSELELPL